MGLCLPQVPQCTLENGLMTRDLDMECWMTSSGDMLPTHHGGGGGGYSKSDRDDSGTFSMEP